MAIVSVNEIVNRRGRLNPDLSREYERTWRIETDSDDDGPATLFAWGGLAVLSAPYSDPNGVVDQFAYCTGGIDVQPDEDDPRWWTATARYTTKGVDPQTYQTLQAAGVAPGSYDPGTTGFPVAPGGVPASPSAGQQAVETSPLLRPPVIVWDSRDLERYELHDLNDRPYVNSAGELLDPIPATLDVVETCSITRNEADPINHTGLSLYRNAINDVAWFGYAAKRVRCVGIKAQSQFEGGLFYWQVTYGFEMKSKGRIWETKAADVGFAYKDAGGALVPFLDKYGSPVTRPGFLDGAGGKFTGNPTTDAINFRTFTTYATKDFNLLHLI